MATAAVELRIRLLEHLVYGGETSEARSGASLARRADDLLRGFNTALDKNGSEAVKRFVDSFEVNEALLRPPLPISEAARARELPATVKATLVLEAQSDFQAIDRDLRELEVLEKRGIAGAGPLAVTKTLLPELRKLQAELPSTAEAYSQLEEHITTLLTQYDEYVQSVSSVFVRMNAVLGECEKKVLAIEKERSV